MHECHGPCLSASAFLQRFGNSSQKGETDYGPRDYVVFDGGTSTGFVEYLTSTRTPVEPSLHRGDTFTEWPPTSRIAARPPFRSVARECDESPWQPKVAESRS